MQAKKVVARVGYERHYLSSGSGEWDKASFIKLSSLLKLCLFTHCISFEYLYHTYVVDYDNIK